MSVVGGACEGIATRDQWSKFCGCADGTIIFVLTVRLLLVLRNAQRQVDGHDSGHKDQPHASMGHGTWSKHLVGP